MLNREYFLSLSEELHALQNRVRSFISDKHWLTDGEWKESVLRAFLRRHLPGNAQVGRGFVISDVGPSNQIDVLIYNSNYPILFKDGDLVFVTPDSVLGIIEVKTGLDNYKFKQAIDSLCATADVVPYRGKIKGLFSFEDNTRDINDTLSIIRESVKGNPLRIPDFVCLGETNFIRFWWEEPGNPGNGWRKWHAYHLDKLARGYFIHNVIEGICPESVNLNQGLWYPVEGKELDKVADIDLGEEVDFHPPTSAA